MADPAAPSADGAVVIDVEGGGAFGAAVLARVVQAMAARADLPVDRVADARLVAEAIATHGTRHAPDGRLRAAVTAAPGRVEIGVGPMRPGGADGLVRDSALPVVGSVLAGLADEVVPRTGDDGDHLTVALVTRPA